MTSSSSPKVFVSYSHESEAHKDWVRRLAERLRQDGVDIVLDQWEIGPGDDVTSFMERTLSSCDRVLIICTEDYIRKANTLKGGVGFERMIVTAEIARDLETRKFIPILRSSVEERLPTFLGPRVYVDLRTGDFDENQYEVLLRALLKAPKHRKPELGRSPYAASQAATKAAKTAVQRSAGETSSSNPEPRETTVNAARNWKYHWHRGNRDRSEETGTGPILGK